MPNYEHLRWTRLDVAPPRKTRDYFPPRPPYRSNAKVHGEKLEDETSQTIEVNQSRRRQYGIDPSKLLVLQLSVVETEIREDLESRLGLHILEEKVIFDTLDNPYYSVLIEFDSSSYRHLFINSEDISDLGVIGFGPVRSNEGLEEPLKLIAKFRSLSETKEFLEMKS